MSRLRNIYYPTKLLHTTVLNKQTKKMQERGFKSLVLTLPLEPVELIWFYSQFCSCLWSSVSAPTTVRMLVTFLHKCKRKSCYTTDRRESLWCSRAPGRCWRDESQKSREAQLSTGSEQRCSWDSTVPPVRSIPHTGTRSQHSLLARSHSRR